jgi:plasmid replication initiation protein
MSHYVAENRKDILTGRKILRCVFAILRRGKSQGHVAKFQRHVAKIKSWDFAETAEISLVIVGRDQVGTT